MFSSQPKEIKMEDHVNPQDDIQKEALGLEPEPENQDLVKIDEVELDQMYLLADDKEMESDVEQPQEVDDDNEENMKEDVEENMKEDFRKIREEINTFCKNFISENLAN